MLDYIIVGAGLSGIAVAEELISKGRSIKVFENRSQNSSAVAGGMYNPVILKRFTLAWRADEQLETSIPFYQNLEEKLNVSLVKPLPVYRKFSSVEEQNNWFAATDKASLAPFLDSRLTASLNPCIPAPFSFGTVKGTGTVNTSLLLDAYREYLLRENILKMQDFDHNLLETGEANLKYNGVAFKKLIFCEGFGLKNNPLFNYLPLRGNKGEYLLIRAPKLKLESAVKSSVFILPQGDDIYKIGATYNPRDSSPEPTEAAKKTLLAELSKMLKCDFEVIGQVAGIRPATSDRKPLVGSHPAYKNVYCCNGFGSRGVLIAPYASKRLVQFMEQGIALPEEIDIKRFESRA